MRKIQMGELWLNLSYKRKSWHLKRQERIFIYKINDSEKIKDFFLKKFRQQLLLIRMSPLSSPKFFGGNCFLSLISFMLNQKLSWNISMNMTHQKLLCGEMKLKPAWGWLTSDANKPKCQNNAGVISPTVSWGSDL